MRRVAAPDPRSQLTARIADVLVGTRYEQAPDGTRTAHDDSRHTLLVEVSDGPTLDGVPQFGPGDDSFPPWACGSCDLWECNASERYATWVRRSGDCVVWLVPNSDVFVFDGWDYESALRLVGSDPEVLWTHLPVLDYAGGADTRFDLWLDRETVRARSEALQIAVDTVLLAPERWDIPFELVAPPAEAWSIDDAGYFAHDGERWQAYLPGLFGLPSWFASPVVDDMARVLGLGG